MLPYSSFNVVCMQIDSRCFPAQSLEVAFGRKEEIRIAQIEECKELKQYPTKGKDHLPLPLLPSDGLPR